MSYAYGSFSPNSQSTFPAFAKSPLSFGRGFQNIAIVWRRIYDQAWRDFQLMTQIYRLWPAIVFANQDCACLIPLHLVAKAFTSTSLCNFLFTAVCHAENYYVVLPNVQLALRHYIRKKSEKNSGKKTFLSFPEWKKRSGEESDSPSRGNVADNGIVDRPTNRPTARPTHIARIHLPHRPAWCKRAEEVTIFFLHLQLN